MPARKSSRKSNRKSSRKSNRKPSRKSSRKPSRKCVKPSNDMLKKPMNALCMKCFHSSGRKTSQSPMSMKGRCIIVNKRGREMLQGFCANCGGKMNKFI